MVLRLSALRIGRLYLQEIHLVLISIRGWVDPRAGRIMSLKNSNDNISLVVSLSKTGCWPIWCHYALVSLFHPLISLFWVSEQIREGNDCFWGENITLQHLYECLWCCEVCSNVWGILCLKWSTGNTGWLFYLTTVLCYFRPLICLASGLSAEWPTIMR
jgi:hypothetical protein